MPLMTELRSLLVRTPIAGDFDPVREPEQSWSSPFTTYKELLAGAWKAAPLLGLSERVNAARKGGNLIAAGWIVGKARAVVVDRGSRVRIAVKVDTEGVLRDAVDAHPFVRGTLNTASVGDRIDVGSRIGHRVGSRRKLRLKFIIAISRSGIPGRHARSIDDVDGAADGKRCARRRQEARRRSALERVGILRRKPATTLFKARERRVVHGRSCAVVAGNGGFRAGRDEQRNGHDADQQQDENGNQQGDSCFPG